jgi:hypothetical protein
MAVARSLGMTIGSTQRKRVTISKLGMSSKKKTTESLKVVGMLEIELRGIH